MMNTNRGKIKELVAMTAVIIIASLWSLAAANDAGQDDPDEKRAKSLKAIERRLTNLEKQVGSSRSPVAERSEVLEKRLCDLTKAMGGTGWSSVENNLREAKKTLTQFGRHRQKQDEDLRKLKKIGGRIERFGDDLDKFRRAMDEMGRRLRRLESRS